jgi:hypothetical protein
MYDQYIVACNHVFIIHQSLSLFLVVMMLLLAFLVMEGLISTICVYLFSNLVLWQHIWKQNFGTVVCRLVVSIYKLSECVCN